MVNDKTTIKEASKKARMNVTTAGKYYREYFNAQNPDITAPSHIATCTRYTQGQIKEVISYIVNDKMSIRAASRKANIHHVTAWIHYRQYLKDNNMESYATNYGERFTQDEINKLIGYITDDKMSVKAASKKASLHYETGKIYYRQYVKSYNLDTPTQKHTQDRINQLIGYIVDNKMSVIAASKKANMSSYYGYKYYQQYRNNQKQ